MILREYRQEIRGASWLTVEKVIRLLVGVIVTGIVARHLGVESFGILMNGYSCMGIAMLFLGLGLRQALPRILCEETNFEQRRSNMGSSLGITIITAIICLCLFNLAFIKANSVERAVVFFMSLTLLNIPLAILLSAAFQASSKMDLAAKSAIFGLLLGAALRVSFALLDKSPPWFAFSFMVEISFISLIQFYFYRKKLPDFPQSFPLFAKQKRKLIRAGLPLFLAGLATYTYMQIDVVFLRNIIGASEAGIYSAATRLSQIAIALPALLLTSFTGKLMKGKENSIDNDFAPQDTLLLSRLIGGGAILATLTLYLIGPFLISLIYGSGFEESKSVFRWHILSLPFIFWGSLRNHFLILKSRGKLITICEVTGAISNVLLNLYLIPRYGATGAAIATIVSYAIAYVGINFFIRDLRPYLTMAPAALGIRA